MDDSDHLIREKAYELWEKEGSPHGRDEEFWERARLMVTADQARAAAPPAEADRNTEAEKNEEVALEDTFPASDPPSFTAEVGVGKSS